VHVPLSLSVCLSVSVCLCVYPCASGAGMVFLLTMAQKNVSAFIGNVQLCYCVNQTAAATLHGASLLQPVVQLAA